MTTWIISTDPHLEALLELARGLDGEVVLIDAGCGPVASVDRVLSVADGSTPAEALAPAVVAAIEAGPADVVLVRNGPAERVLAGAVAAKLDASVLSDVRELNPEVTTVGRLGGITLQDVRTERVRVVIADGGAEATSGGAAESGPAVAAHPMSVTATQHDDRQVVDLSNSRRVLSVGMGFRAEQDLALAQRVAEKIGADLACSRPVAEGHGWMPRESYIGVTGLRIAPQLYLAVGISGQLQHLAGVREAKTIVAVNSDANAPIFKACDYGVVGDLYQVLPALAEQLG
jgi:electron transfer flavoprotein alpha subunit